MKKKGIAILLCTLLLCTSCGAKKEDLTVSGSESSNEATGSVVDNSANESEENVDSSATTPEVIDYNQYVTLGEYKNFNMPLEVTEVTEEEIASYIDYALSNSTQEKEVTDRTAALGDTLNIDFEGYVDDNQFEGGTATGYSIVLGSKSFIDDFEDQLVGSKAGDVVNVNVTFPEAYGNEELNGKEALFIVTVNGIYQSVVPELNEEWVTANTDYTSIDEYKAGVKKDLEEEALVAAKDNLTYEILDKIISNSTVIGYPENEVNNYANYLREYYAYYASMMGMDYETFLQSSGMTVEQFEEESIVMAQDTILRQMVCQLVAEKEELTISDEVYTEYANGFVVDYGYESLEAFEKDYGRESIESNIRMELALDFIYSNNVVE